MEEPECVVVIDAFVKKIKGGTFVSPFYAQGPDPVGPWSMVLTNMFTYATIPESNY